MAGPWEKFQSAEGDGPWAKFGDSAPAVKKKKDEGIGEWIANTFGPNGNLRGSAIGGAMQGAADVGAGGVQLVANALGLGDKVNTAIADKEKEYQAARASAGREGFDAARLAGNVAITLPASGVGAVAPAASLSTRIAAGAAQGSGMAALNPITNGGENYWSDKGGEVATGAAAGGVMAPVVGALGRIISPNASTNAELKLLKESGVNPTVGQTLGGFANSLEEKAMSIPGVGDMIRRARQSADSGFRDAAYARALSPIGETVESKGRDAIGEIGAKLGQSYEKILPKLSVDATNPEFVAKMSNLRSMVQSLPEDSRRYFDGIISREIDSRLAPNGMLSGQNLKDAWNALRDQGTKLSKSPDAFQSDLGQAFKQAFQELKDHVSASNPADVVSQLKNTDLGYANFKRLQRAAASVGAESGNFSPAQLQSAVKAADRSKDKGGFARGDALMQDLTDAGKNILSTKYPDSGTTGRGIVAGLAGGGAYLGGALAPVLAGTTAGMVAYTKPVQNALVALASSRPDLAPEIANALRRMTPYASTVATSAALNQ